jgi:hypothetical protein
MGLWSELHIGIVYYTGLIIAIITGLLIILYLKQAKVIIKKITAIPRFWSGSFKITVILSALLGAMSVSFRDCSGKYDYLLESKHETYMKGIEQISTSFQWIAFILILWLFIFSVLWLISKKHRKTWS